MDLGAAVDQLYKLPRDQFVAERDKLAKAQPALAERIRKLRKPTVAAWQANQLAREHNDHVAALVALGEDLRRAQEALDGPALRTLSRHRIEALDELVGLLPDAAAGLRELLERAIADPETAEDLLAGRMVTEPAASGWGFELAMPTPTAEHPQQRQREDEKPLREREKGRAEARHREAEKRQQEPEARRQGDGKRRQAEERRRLAAEKRQQEAEVRRQEQKRQAEEARRQEEKRQAEVARRQEETRRREYAAAKAAHAEAQQALTAAANQLQTHTDRVQRLQAELAEARAARNEAASTVKRAQRQLDRTKAALRTT